MPIIDVWMQHPTHRFARHDMFESLRRWTGQSIAPAPVEDTVAAMDEAGVARGLVCAWYGPDGPLISNDEVAAVVARYPDRFTGVASVDLGRPVEAIRELRRAVHDLSFRALRQLDQLELDDETRALFLHGNAQRVFNLLGNVR
jgi:predicted TIM-barrel fold metal-dependent hydrolase